MNLRCRPMLHTTLHRYSLGCLLLLLAACGTPPPPVELAIDTPRVEQPARTRERTSPQDLLQRAESARGDAAAELRHEAASLLYDDGDSDQAANVLADIDLVGVNPELQSDILLLRAQLQLEGGDARAVLELLQPTAFPALTTVRERHVRRYHRLRAQAYYATEAMLSSALERIQLDRVLDPEDVAENHERIWEALGTIPRMQLEALASTAINYEVRGWYELALLARDNGSDLDRQVVELRRWRDTWARHPAATIPPPEMELIETMARERPRQIALLLPLTIPAGTIVRDAFMSAYYNLLEQGGQVPEIRLYDAGAEADILALHQRAVQEGAQLVIGPLLKEQVAVLQSVVDLNVPTLALNNIEGSAPASPQLYQFALSPEDEARQLAQKAWRDGHRRAAILHPADDLRKRDSFASEWERLGGEVVSSIDYRDNFTDAISRMLELDQSNARHRRLNELLRKQTQFAPRRRQDVDFLYLVAQPAPARQIVPSLAYLYAGNIPVYASQDVHSGVARPVEDRDLNGVTFPESPWLLGQIDTSVVRSRELFPQVNAQTLRLQAFGIDAFRLYPRLPLLAANANATIPGASGLLRLGAQQNIIRQLSWASIQDGMVRAIE
jgi:outer membrane PBP1 activator LpoA protein